MILGGSHGYDAELARREKLAKMFLFIVNIQVNARASVHFLTRGFYTPPKCVEKADRTRKRQEAEGTVNQVKKEKMNLWS